MNRMNLPRIPSILKIGAALIGGLVAATAYAQQSPGTPTSVSVTAIDKNDNGRISRSEYVAFTRRAFTELADSRDGQSTREAETPRDEHLWEYQRHPRRIYRNY